MTKEEILKQLKNGMIVSCQALPHEPMYTPEGGVMPLFAKAAKQAGACGIRANGIRDILEIQQEVDLPIIGIIKKDYPETEAYITPSMNEVDALVKIGCDIIATDLTQNTRVGGLSAQQFMEQIRSKYPHILIMADISTLQEALDAQSYGVDFIGTTLSGYTRFSEPTEGPNFDLVKQIVERVEIPVIAEGKIHEPEQAKRMLELGAHCVVVGGAITRPLEIAQRFINAIK